MIRWNGRPPISRPQATFLFCVLIFALTSAPEVRAQLAQLSIQTLSLPPGVVDIAYSFTMTGTGGQPPYTWSAQLPSLLSMNSSTGQITGIPTVEGKTPVTVTLKDSAQTTQTKNFTLVIILALSVATVSLPSGNFDKPYPSVLLAARGGTP